MKEKLLQLKEKIMLNKKKAVAIGIAALLLIGAGGYGIVVWMDGSNDETAKIVKCELEEDQADKKVVKTDTADEKSEKADADKEKNEKKSSADKKETKKIETVKKEEKKEDTKNSGTKAVSTDKAKPSGNSASGAGTAKTENNTQPSVPAQKQETAPAPQPSAPDPEPTPTPQPQPEPKPESSSKPEPPAHVHDYSIPITTQQWVVDQPAWTETVNEPVYEMVERCICNQCGVDITANVEQHMLDYMHGWHSEWIQQQTGTNSYTVDHPEQGHYETVTTGYKCSCGAAQ